MYFGETEPVNKTHERWCQSKEIVFMNSKSINFKLIEMRLKT
jgi:hypothetical protein